MRWTPHEPIIALAHQDHSVYTWDIDYEYFGSSHGVGHTRKVLALDWSPDGTKRVSGGEDTTVRTWNIPGFQPAKTQGEADISTIYDLNAGMITIRDLPIYFQQHSDPEARRLIYM